MRVAEREADVKHDLLTSEGGGVDWLLIEVDFWGRGLSAGVLLLSSISSYKGKEFITPPPQKQISVSQIFTSSCDNSAYET